MMNDFQICTKYFKRYAFHKFLSLRLNSKKCAVKNKYLEMQNNALSKFQLSKTKFT